MNQLLRDDASLIFQDWGQTAQLIEVCSRYNALTGQIEELTFAAEILVVPATVHVKDAPETAATTALTTQRLLVREIDLPSQTPLTSHRVEYRGERYEVHQVRPSSLAGVVVLECVRFGECSKP